MKQRRHPGERLRELSFARLVPNIVTLLSLCAGATALRFALEGSWKPALAAILIAAVLDTLDGGMARLLDVDSRLGAQLDSLADLISFGAAPAVVLYAWTMHGAGSIGWALALLFCVCAALRLARFNIMRDAVDNRPGWAGRYFTGIPTPAAAGIVLLPVLLSFQFPDGPFSHIALNGAVIVVTSLMMVSRAPTFSLKGVRLKQKHVLPTLLFVGLLAGFAVDAPWETLTVVLLLYVASLPVSMLTYRRLNRRFAAAGAGAAAGPGAGDTADGRATDDGGEEDDAPVTAVVKLRRRRR